MVRSPLNILWGLSVLLGLMTLPACANPTSTHGGVIVGAIRWDAWFDGNTYENNLAPKQWRSRLPFYASVRSDDRVEVRSDKQEVMDQEIAFAAKAGLNYWAFCYYHPKSWA